MSGISATKQPMQSMFPHLKAVAPLPVKIFKGHALKPSCAILTIYLHVEQEKLMLYLICML